jgi:hypothetical protein
MSTALDPDSASFMPAMSSTALSAVEMAHIVDEHVAALWRGEESGDGPFYRWLGSCLRTGDAPEPAGRPAAISRLAAGGTGIRWHETPTAILGFVPGVRDACYVVSRYACPPWFRAKS